jgi:hypothetical protein
MTKYILGTFALLTLSSLASDSLAAGTDGSFIVSSQVVSDSVTPPSAYVGDVPTTTDGGINGGSSSCGDGSCGGGASGSCGDTCASCGVGSNGGRCGKCGGGVLGKLLSGKSPNDKGGYYQPRKYDHSDLFYNYYSQGNYNTANAQMYISPVPVPAFVGHTFNTYQPFYPHEFMYWHKNRFHNNYDNGRGMNRTKALYYAPPVRTAMKNLYWNKLRLPR